MFYHPVTERVTTVLPPPEGYVVDFNHPQTQYHAPIYCTFAIGGVLALLFVAQRLYTQMIISKGLHSDDVFLILSWLASLLSQIPVLYEASVKAVGVHGWEISTHKYKTYMMCSMISTFAHVLCGGWAKLSILVSYFRLSPQKGFKMAVFAAMGIVACYTLVFFGTIFVCNPPQRSWDIHVTGGQCNTHLNMAIAIVNAITDVVLFILPITMAVQFQMPLGQKAGVVFVFTVATATLVTSVARCCVFMCFLGDKDNSWISAPISMWTGIEANLFVMCAALPTLHKFLNHIAPNVFGLPRELSQSDKAAQSSNFGYPRSNRNNYAKFSEESELDIIPKEALKVERHVTIQGNTGNGGWKMERDGSNQSLAGNQAIVETKTFTIEYAQGYLYKI
ncbi:integral membrane protein [Whalleya microplaca]|nr:integral membrane protein [Whalleya microplaca]